MLVIGLLAGYAVRRFLSSKEASSLDQKSKKIVLEAQEKAAALIEEARKEEHDRKAQIDNIEERLLKKDESLEQRARDLAKEQSFLKTEYSKIEKIKQEVGELQQKTVSQLEKIAGLSASEAKARLIKEIQEEHHQEMVKTLQDLERNKRDEIEKRSLDIITTALQRYARSHVTDLTTTVFHLPNEEIKGKIIGREGRNIRTLERGACFGRIAGEHYYFLV